MDYISDTNLSRNQIREMATFVRRKLGVESLEFPAIKMLDRLETLYPDYFYYVIEEDQDFDNGVMSYLQLDSDGKYCAHFRQRVYDGALEGKGNFIGFIVHEIAHFCLEYFFDIHPEVVVMDNTPFYACVPNGAIKEKYESIEWQAKALCGEIMIPFEQCKEMSFGEIVEKTKSSKAQTDYFLNVVVPRST